MENSEKTNEVGRKPTKKVVLGIALFGSLVCVAAVWSSLRWPGATTLTIFNPHDVSCNVFANGRNICTLEPFAYARINLSPANYEFRAVGKNNVLLDKAGKILPFAERDQVYCIGGGWIFEVKLYQPVADGDMFRWSLFGKKTVTVEEGKDKFFSLPMIDGDRLVSEVDKLPSTLAFDPGTPELAPVYGVLGVHAPLIAPHLPRSDFQISSLPSPLRFEAQNRQQTRSIRFKEQQ
jgi:hypothetical protein